MAVGGGSYLALSLRFPNAATAAQRKRGETGVSLDFVVDTGATYARPYRPRGRPRGLS